MKTYTLSLAAMLLSTCLVSGACTKGKQESQQPNENSTTTDARHDLSNQANPVSGAGNEGKDQSAVTTNPNSSRESSDSTINTSAGAAVVGDQNINPRREGEAGKVPTSTDTARSGEPRSDAAVDNVNCRDAIANDFNGKSEGKTNNCPPSSTSPINSDSPGKQVGR